MDTICTPFCVIFREYKPEGERRAAASALEVSSIAGDRRSRSIEVQARASRLIAPELIAAVEDEVRAAYSLSRFSIHVVYPPELLDDAYMKALFSRVKGLYPASNGFLDGAESEFTEDKSELVIRLSGGGADFLTNAGCAREMERILQGEFGLRTKVRFQGVTDLSREAAEKLSDEARARELERVRSLPPEQAAAQEPKRPAAPRPRQPEGGMRRPSEGFSRPRARSAQLAEGETVLMGRPYEDAVTGMDELHLDLGSVTVRGEVFALNHREIRARNLQILNFDMTDRKNSIRVSRAMDLEKAKPIVDEIRVGDCLCVQGQLVYNNFEDEMVLNPKSIVRVKKPERLDTAEKKRVELHLHTSMSSMDGVSDVGALVKRAVKWGHPAIAITDHGVAQAFPDAMKAARGTGIKVIYGLEAYYVNNRSEAFVVVGPQDAPLDGEFVVFDIETTGLSPKSDAVTEIGAVVLRNGEEAERFTSFVNPGRPIPANITELTGITDAMVRDAPPIADVLPRFLAFVGGRILVAHNASFDVSFIRNACEASGLPAEFTYIDTLELSRGVMPELAKHKLDVLAGALGVGDFNHHRASDDAAVLAKILVRLFEKLRDQTGVTRVSEINEAVWGLRRDAQDQKRAAYHHLIILVKNYTGLKNLYRLISISHLEHFRKRPIIPRDVLEQYRDGLILGSACEAGELFSSVVRGRPWAELKKLAEFYDYLEIQPIGNNAFMLENGTAKSEDELRAFNETILRLGQATGKPVVATGDVHFLDPSDEVFRRILMAGQGFNDADHQAPLYFRTTDEMLEEFSYLGAKRAYEVVVENPNRIAEQCEAIQPVPDGTYPPEIEGSAEQLKELTMARAHELYGDTLPDLVRERIELELTPIIKHGFDVMYMTAQKLVSKSVAAGYLVGSRGSVGSSVVAFLSGITEVNALPAHYRCEHCRTSEFMPEGQYGCGADMPDKNCPICGQPYKKDGFDIPFATFLGFDGDKAPDIDLNFSGEYQARAHRNTVELFGEGQVFRAGTIGTIAEKTAFGYVKKYAEERGLKLSKAETNRLTLGCTGVKRTTGQHPGGLIIVPRSMSIYDFCPVQHPADDTDTDIITTHFDFHSIHDNLLKLDLLGHDDPTMIRMLEDLTGLDARAIPLDDPETMRIFTDIGGLRDVNGGELSPDEVLGETGAAAVPEYGTKFVREMLLDTRPKNFDTLVRISGLSHGTDVWLGNAQDLIRSGTATMKEIICARDDIMLFLISKGVAPKLSFTIMEGVRKGKGLKPEWEEAMHEKDVPDWYIASCKKIKYLFPKAHAAAYVMMAFRIAWFKVHMPAAFYSAYFTIRAVGFDGGLMTRGIDAVLTKMREISANPKPTAAEKDQLTTLEVCYEFYRRGFAFRPVDIYRSDTVKFLIDGNFLIPPLTSLPGLGLAAAQDIVDERQKGPFTSAEDLSMRCTKVSKAVIDLLDRNGSLAGLPKSEQVTLFDL